MAELKPDAAPASPARLLLGSAEIPVQLVEERKEGSVTYKWKAHGEVVDSESYEVNPDSFRLKLAVSEAFDPPITLLREPVKVGSSHDWKGKVMLTQDGVPLKDPRVHSDATAQVAVSKERITVVGGPYDSHLVTVKLMLQDEKGTPAKERLLRFWFVPGKGIVKRDFSESSSREPAPPKE